MKTLLAALLGFGLAASGAHAATYYVAPTGNDANAGTQAAPFRTIAKGIATAAASGDTVFLANGTYNERGLDFGSKNLVLRSSSDAPGSCILDCQGLGNGFYFRGGQTNPVRRGSYGASANNGQDLLCSATYERRSPDISMTSTTFTAFKSTLRPR